MLVNDFDRGMSTNHGLSMFFSPPLYQLCEHYFKIGMAYIALGVGAIISKNKGMNSGSTRTMVYRFSIVIEFF